jgi:predicted nuclease with TOPRIM domain
MQPRTRRAMPTITVLLLSFLWADYGLAGVSRPIQDKYRRSYENKALFLKIPIFGERQYVFLRGNAVTPDQGSASGPARYKVGDQVRILGIDFGGDEIKFKLAAIAGAGLAEIIFKFDSALAESFPNSSVFDRALDATFTEGLKYSDLEQAKRDYVAEEFERSVREMAATSGSGREAVLKSLAPLVPAYQDALRDIDNLKGQNQGLSAQIAQAQADNRRLDTELRSQQAESARLRSTAAALQDKIDNSTSQLSKLGDDLRSAHGTTQGYQKELANLQRSLNIKVDSSRELASQIAELGQALRRIQKESEGLAGQNSTLRANVQKLQSQNALLAGEVEDAKNANKQLRDTISTLTSKEDSLARQYIELKKNKENLETVLLAIESLNARTVEEKTESGYSSGKVDVFLRNVPLGSLEWRLPVYLNPNEQGIGEASFSADSIDYVRVTPEERLILRSLGERLKLDVKLSPLSGSMDTKPEKGEALQEVGERDRGTWRWRILNRGSQDARFVLAVRLKNRNADEIPFLRQEHLVGSANVIRQVRGYLQPIPIGLGAVLGFLLFGIVGIFRRGMRSSENRRQRPPLNAPGSSSYSGQKQL